MPFVSYARSEWCDAFNSRTYTEVDLVKEMYMPDS